MDAGSEGIDEVAPDAEWWPLRLKSLANELNIHNRDPNAASADVARIPRLAVMVVYRLGIPYSRDLPPGYSIYTMPNYWPVRAVPGSSRLFTTTDLAEVRMWLLRRYAELTT